MIRFEIPSHAARALERLHSAGHEAWLVGGCVRDHLLGRVPKDYDIATAALPEETLAVFAGEKCVETGLQHGTVTVILEGRPLEITTFRVDGAYSDVRHPDEVRFSRSLAEDAARRDFTVNAMAYDPEKGLWDGFGGQEDLARRTVRCVGDPEARFREDALRILRGFRFASELDFTLESGTLEAACRAAPLLERIAAERVSAELERLLTGPGAGRVIRLGGPVLQVLFPELFREEGDVCGLTARIGDRLDRCPARLPLRLAVLLLGADGRGTGDAPSGTARAGEILRRLRFPGRVREETETLLRFRDADLRAEPETVLRWMSRLGAGPFLSLLAFRRAVLSGEEDAGRAEEIGRTEALARELLAGDPCLSVRDLAVDGRALLALGYRGAEIGRVQRRLLDEVLSGSLPNEREALLRSLGKPEPDPPGGTGRKP